MAVAIPFIMIAGAALAASNAAQQGKAAKAAGDYNASIARQDKQIVREQTIQEVQQHDREQLLREGAIRAQHAKSGGKAEGSVLDLLSDTAAQGEIARQDIVYRGALRERGYENSARLDEYEGAQGLAAGRMRAGSELLQGGSNAYGGYLRRT